MKLWIVEVRHKLRGRWLGWYPVHGEAYLSRMQASGVARRGREEVCRCGVSDQYRVMPWVRERR